MGAAEALGALRATEVALRWTSTRPRGLGMGGVGSSLAVATMPLASSATRVTAGVTTSRPIGVEQSARDEPVLRNDRFFAVPVSSHREDEPNHVDPLSKRLRRELERFFEQTRRSRTRRLRSAWRGSKTARRLLDEGIERFRKSGES